MRLASRSSWQTILAAGLVSAATLGWAVVPAFGQSAAPHDLSGAVPEKSLLYVGWSGAASAPAKVETALTKLLAEPEIRTITDTYGEAAWKAISAAMAKGAGPTTMPAGLREHGLPLLGLLWRYPVALSVRDVTMGEQGPGVNACLMVRAGSDAKAVQEHFEALVTGTGDLPADALQIKTIGGLQVAEITPPGPPIPIRWFAEKGYFVVTIGDEMTEAVLKTIRGEATPLAMNARFVEATKGVGGSDGFATAYIDIGGVLETLKTFQPMFAQEQVPVLGDAKAFALLQSSRGLGDLQALAFGVRPEANGYATRVFLLAPGKSKGIGDLFGAAKPVRKEVLSLVPADASLFATRRVDLGALLGKLTAIMRAADAKSADEFDNDIAAAEKEIGFRIREDLLASLGDEWLLYDCPSTAGLWLLGVTASVDVRDGDKVASCLDKLVAFAGEQTEEVSLGTYEYRGVKVRTVEFAGEPIPVAPAYAIHDGRLFIGLFPQSVRAAIDRKLDKAPDITTNPDFARAMALMPPEAIALWYVDMPRAFRGVYPVLLTTFHALAGQAASEGIEIPVGILPSLPVLTKHLFGSIGAQVVTDQGVLWVTHGPVPLDPATAGVTAQLVAVGLFSSSEVIVTDMISKRRRVQSMENLHQIALGLAVYADKNDNKFPSDLKTLIKDGLDEETLISPANPDEKEPYVYIEGQRVDSPHPSRTVVVYEKPENYGDKGTNVLFADSHVQWVPKDQLDRLLDETYKRLGRTREKPGTTSEKADDKKP